MRLYVPFMNPNSLECRPAKQYILPSGAYSIGSQHQSACALVQRNALQILLCLVHLPFYRAAASRPFHGNTTCDKNTGTETTKKNMDTLKGLTDT